MSIDKNFDSNILDKIKNEDIKPKAKWRFLAKDYVVWFLGVVSLLVGGLAFSLILFVFKYGGWELVERLDDSVFEFILVSVPYFWIILLALFVYAVNYNIKHTKRGYKYSLALLTFVNIASSIVLGFLFLQIGITQAVDDVLSARVSAYPHIINPQLKYWDSPESGRLAGLVIAQDSEGNFQLIDIRRKEWIVVPVEIPSERRLMIEIGRPVRLIGVVTSENVFEAHKAMIHQGPGRGMMRDRIKSDMMRDDMLKHKLQIMQETREVK